MAGRDYIIRGRGPQAVAEAAIETVSDLTRRIKAALESAVPACWVRGEISNLRAQASGHVYFSLKDATSQVACVMFRGDAARTGTVTALRDGAQVVVFGELSVYEPRGNYQLIVRAAIDDGLGRLQLQFEQLKQRLAAEGLFDPARKRPLPVLPRTIGFITSPTGAALQDFVRILRRRGWHGRLVVLPVKVQGEGAAAEMVAALELAGRLDGAEDGSPVPRAGVSAGATEALPPFFDLLVIGRGGGSLEDLWAFNEEPLARAVAACPIPIISAVGHEIDFTLSDFAADVRAETPSAAAELISSGYLDVIERVRQAGDALDVAIDDGLRDRRTALDLLRGRLAAASPTARIEQSHLRLDDLHNRLEAATRHRLQEGHQQIVGLAERLAAASPHALVGRARERLQATEARLERELTLSLERKRQALARLAERLDAAGPQSVLRRGFVILRDAEQRPVTSRSKVRRGDGLTAQWHDGEMPLRAE